MRVSAFLACGLLLAAAEISVPQQMPRTGDLPRRLRGSLQDAGDDSTTNGSDRLKQDVQAPLRAAAAELKEGVSKLLLLSARDSETKAENSSEVLASLAVIRKLVADVVPKVLAVRDVSSAVDMDPRPKNTSQATNAQRDLATMQKYWAWAWPVIIEQVDLAFDERPTISPRVDRGIDGSLTFLEPAMKQAWQVEKFVIPVVQSLVSDVGNTSAAMMEKASCSSSFAEGLGDLTNVYAQLAEAQKHCTVVSAGSENTMAASSLTCAQDLVGALASVAGSISQASSAMWECFGIAWECAQIINLALESSIQALAKSLDMSSACKSGAASCSLRSAFAAYGDLWNAAAALEGAAQPGSCFLKGSHELHALNPYAATPADLKLPTSTSAGKSNKGFNSFSRLFLLEVAAGAMDSQLSAEVVKTFSGVSSSIESLLQSMLVEVVEATQTKNTSGLAKMADDVLDVMGAEVSKFLVAVNETSAVSEQVFTDGPAMELRKRAQQDIITMMDFTIFNAPEAVHKLAEVAGARGTMTNKHFVTVVNGKVQKARLFLGDALRDAWQGLSLQIPRITDLTDAKYLSKSVEWAECAAAYAGSLGKLTHLYSKLAATGSDCKPDDELTFDTAVCESDLLADFSSIQQTVNMASSMMQTCFKGSWECMQTTSKASEAMLSSLAESISVKANCITGDAPDICKSSALSLVGHLVVAANAVDASKLECKEKS